MVTPFHIRYAPDRAALAAAPPSPPVQAKFQALLRELFQFDCADLDFGIYRVMNHKREVIDRYIDRDLPGAIEEAVGRGAIQMETERAKRFEETREKVIEAFGEDAVAPTGELTGYQETPLGKEYAVWRERTRHSESAGDVRRDIYNHLYSFFSRYYQDGDFVPRRRYSWEHPYVVPYNGEEVHFHWANRGQYYVKAAEHFTDYRYRTRSGVSVRFSVRSASVEQNDVKGKDRFFFPLLDKAAWDSERRVLELPFDHRLPTAAEDKDLKRNGQQATILERAEASVHEALAAAPEAAKALLDPSGDDSGDEDAATLFTHHVRRFARKRTSDFFIHRDLRAFLARELDYYLRSEVLRLRSMVAGGEARADAWIEKVRIIRKVGTNVIEFLAQIEGFQKMLWEKRKFVVDVGYCVAVALVPEELVPRVVACEAQWEEWRAMGCAGVQEPLFAGGGDAAARADFLKRNPGVMLDTRHFDAEFTADLLAALEDVDDLTDGVAIRGDNWQALNLLDERYRRKLACVYIDPPYNSKTSEILYKNTYKHSSWLSLMEDRLLLSQLLAAPDGSHIVAIDENEQEVLGCLLSLHFPEHNKVCVSVVHNKKGIQGRHFSYNHDFAFFCIPHSLAGIAGRPVAKSEWRYDNLRKWGRESERSTARNCFYAIYVEGENIVDFGDVCAEEFHPGRANVADDGPSRRLAVYPVDSKGVERKWRYARQTVESIRDLLVVHRTKSGEVQIHKAQPEVAIKTVWDDPRYIAGDYGTKWLTNLGLKSRDDMYPKSVHTVEDSVRTVSDPDATTLDYFAGSGTTGHAVINLNREDGGRRKFILVEMGDHFDTVLMPRLKKVAFSPEWKNGRAVRPATAEESRRGPRIIKYFRLESYEDALNNIEFEQPDEDMFGVEDYMLRYMLRWETRRSATFLNVAALERPFDYKLRLNGNADGEDVAVDVPETFNYLLGLAVRTRRVHDDDGRRYLVYAGRTRDRREAVVIWRDTEGWTLEDRQRDRDFVADRDLTAGADDVWMNGDTMVEGGRSLDALFKKRMFGSVTD